MDNKLALSLVTLLILTTAFSSSWAANTMTDKCNDSFTKVGTCLDFATGKSVKPAKDCCASVDQIKGSEPVCLCYIIQQTNNGSQTTKGVGLRVDRLLQLPSVCHLANASLADCPKLLNISPTSPDYAIFTNTTSTPSTPSTGTAGSSTSPTTNGSSIAFKMTPSLVGLITTIMAISVFLKPHHTRS